MTVTVRIERLAAGGDGVGRLADGRVVFVPRTAPGDEVEAVLTREKRRWARGRVARVVVAGPDRREPPCPHYTRDDCGGCQLQHLEPAAQLTAKRRIVGDALQRIGRRAVAAPEVAPAPRPWRYRSKITLAVAADAVGLHPYDRPDRVFALQDCQITREPLMELWRHVAGHRALLPAATTHVVLREDREGRLHVIVRGGDPPWDPAPLARVLADPGVSLWWEPARGAARVVAGRDTAFPATAFTQVDPVFASAIREAALAGLGPAGGRIVWDLYGGIGESARRLAAAGDRVWSVDADRAAVAWAREQEPVAGAPEASPRWIAGRVEEVLHRLPVPDAVLVNPPRTGLATAVTAALTAWGASSTGARLVYVSCDPATLARDLTRLPAFRVESVRAFDLFPQTSHVESVVVLEAA